MTNLASLNHVVPELTLGGFAILSFLLSAVARKPSGWTRTVFPSLAMLALGSALVLLLGGAVLKVTSNPECGPDGCRLFFGLLSADPLSIFFRALIFTAALIGVVLSLGSPSLPPQNRGEYHGLLLMLSLFMGLLSTASHLLLIYVCLEAVSLCSYLLVGWDVGRQRSREAGLKYVLYGGVASGIMLFGMSILYGLFGDLSLQGIQTALANPAFLEVKAGQWAAIVAVLFVLCGLGYKVAAVPFHMWCPDAYEGAPTPFTAILSVAPKAAGFAVLIRFFYGIFLTPGSQDVLLEASGRIPWVLLLGVVSALTMTLGNLAAIMQNNLKRLLAYSSIAHAGYLLMGVAAGGREGFEAVTLYLAVYLVMNMGAFAVVSAVDRAQHSESLRAYRGLGRRAPLLALTMAVFLFSLTGLPPTAGFIGKLYLFAALIHKGGFGFVLLAVIGVVNSVVSLYYYARVLRTMYLEKTDDAPPLAVPGVATAVAAVLSLPILLLGIFWQPLANIARWSASLLH